VSFFAAITKYQPSTLTNPGENRLTEVLAAVLRTVDPSVAIRLAKYLLDPGETNRALGERRGQVANDVLEALDSVGSVDVDTQRPLCGRFVDIELRFHAEPTEAATALPLVVRIEVKHGTKPSNGQVIAYEQRVGGDPTVPVVILAPTDYLPFENEEEAPVTAPQRSWEGTSRLIQAIAAEGGHDEKEEWLLKELHDFLREEGLVPVEKMKQEHVDALAIRHQANSVLEVLIAGAHRRIAERWGEDGSLNSGGGRGWGSWKHYPHSPSDGTGWLLPDGAWLEFKTSGRLNSPVETAGDVVFIAGLSWRPRNAPVLPDGVSARLQELKPAFLEFREGGCDRIMRVATPGDFLKTGDQEGATIEGQGQALGDWVVGAFQDVNREFRRGTRTY
jgi:hypothetical protein